MSFDNFIKPVARTFKRLFTTLGRMLDFFDFYLHKIGDTSSTRKWMTIACNASSKTTESFLSYSVLMFIDVIYRTIFNGAHGVVGYHARLAGSAITAT